MNQVFAKYLHSISLRIPQRYALRSGLRVFVYTKQQHNLFWTLFSSPEYIQFLRPLLSLKKLPLSIIDGGAACGYFSLLIEHYIRCGLLPWTIKHYTLIEPMDRNLKMLKVNSESNLRGRATIHKGVLGNKSGFVSFQKSTRHPWGGRVVGNENKNNFKIPYVDITDSIKNEWCLVKLDIEGSEFDFINAYQNDFEKVASFIIEWHTECGTYESALATLRAMGFNSMSKVIVTPNRWLEVFINEKCK